jgi:hypothetical protein
VIGKRNFRKVQLEKRGELLLIKLYDLLWDQPILVVMVFLSVGGRSSVTGSKLAGRWSNARSLSKRTSISSSDNCLVSLKVSHIVGNVMNTLNAQKIK